MIQRKEYLEKLIKFQDTDFVKVITGVRRLGILFVSLFTFQ